ncbi:hypothetical protein F5Y17DRAFT_427568 [Xylariaceae sp. FL0594]|nr:hypothetical protein F5Y17DRAFT_427568 [Xylariaceae sp. FL0594]
MERNKFSQDSIWPQPKAHDRSSELRFPFNIWAEPRGPTLSRHVPEPSPRISYPKQTLTEVDHRICPWDPSWDVGSTISQGAERHVIFVDQHQGMPFSLPAQHPIPPPHKSARAVDKATTETGDGYDKRLVHPMVSHYDLINNPTRRTTTVSANYQGNPYSLRNQSADIPDILNTSLWITNLPPRITHATLLKSIRNCGKVYATVINPPGNTHLTSASKIVFFDAEGARNLMRQAYEGTFVVEGYLPRVRHNRIKSEPKPPNPFSRVLHIEGPSVIVNQPCLEALFRGRDIMWQDEEVVVLFANKYLTRIEWRFGSYRCQAEFARDAIEVAKKSWDLKREDEVLQAELWRNVTVHFGIDPCAPQEGKTSLGSSYLSRAQLTAG